MKKIYKLLLVSCFFGVSVMQIQAKLTQDLNKNINAIIEKLNLAQTERNYSAAQFLKDIRGISIVFDKDKKNKIDKTVSPLKAELIKLSQELQKPMNLQRIKELQGWYGGYAYEMPDEILKEYLAHDFRVLQALGHDIPSLESMRNHLKDKRPSEESHSRDDVILRKAGIQKKHMNEDFSAAAKFWLLAPPTKESDFMGGMNYILLKINDDSVMPLLVEELKNIIQEKFHKKIKLEQQQHHIKKDLNIIVQMPGEKALEALLECNRLVIKHHLNGEDYYKSITRHIIRRLASRDAHADRFIDPKMKEINEEQGRTEKPEDIALQDDLWKQYKPLLEARLRDKKDTMPKEDLELIEAALAIMPKGKQLEPKE